MNKRIVDMTGKKYNRLTAIEIDKDKGSSHGLWWKFRCDCGNETTLLGSDVRRNVYKSCGCYNRELTKARNTILFKGKPKLLHSLAGVRAVMRGYIRHAKRRNLIWNLSEEDAIALFESDCFYCGVKPSNSWKGHLVEPFVYNGIDRKDNSKGYTLENVVPCCDVCNHAKAKMNDIEFLSWAERIHAFQQSKG